MPTIVNVTLFVIFTGLVIAVIARSGKRKPKW
jgi:hypothetical protein